MSIKWITIENFKAIGAPQTIDLSPINLIFGPNSAGKSSIIQAIALFSSIMSNSSTDINNPHWGIDLGGFENYVHLHDLDKIVSFTAGFDIRGLISSRKEAVDEIQVRIEIDRDGIKILSYSINNEPIIAFGQYIEPESKYLVHNRFSVLLADTGTLIFSQVSQNYKDAAREFLDLNDDEETSDFLDALIKRVLELDSHADPSTLISSASRINAENSLNQGGQRSIVRNAPWNTMVEAPPVRKRRVSSLEKLTLYEEVFKGFSQAYLDPFFQDWRDLDRREILRKVGRPNEGLEIKDERIGFDPLCIDSIVKYTSVISHLSYLSEYLFEAATHVHSLCSQATDSYDHVGPLRWLPNRRIYASELHRSKDPGTAGWKSLVENESMVKKVNGHLKSLDIKYEVRRRPVYIRGSSATNGKSEHLYDMVLELGDLDTGINIGYRDVGTGISQVIPLLISLNTQSSILSVEQPELHLHPAYQSKLADEIISVFNNGFMRPQILLLETHSEHLILRLQRRIREQSRNTTDVGEISIASADNIKVYYALPTQQGLQLVHLELDDRGNFIGPWPNGFFEERIAEILA